MRERELAMQAALADQRAAEAAIEKQRAFHGEQSERVSAVQGRYYEVGAEISRTRADRSSTRASCASASAPTWRRPQATLDELSVHIERDERQLAELRAEIAQLAPELERAQLAEEQRPRRRWRPAEQRARTPGSSAGKIQPRARRRATRPRRSSAPASSSSRTSCGALRRRRIASPLERDTLAAQELDEQLAALTREGSRRRARTSDELADALAAALRAGADARAEQLAVERRLEAARARARAQRVPSSSRSRRCRRPRSADQAGQAARVARRRGSWRSGRASPQTLEVDGGWERAVETALGDYLEAVCVDELDERRPVLSRGFASGRVTLDRGARWRPQAGAAQTLAAQVQGPAAVRRASSRRCVTAESLSEALQRPRRRWRPASPSSPATGEWLGRDWLRVSRGADPHAGVIEREHRLKALRSAVDAAEERVTDVESRAGRGARSRSRTPKRERDRGAGRHPAARIGATPI